MKRGEPCVIRRFNRTGRPRKDAVPTLTPGVVVRSHGRYVHVEVEGGEVVTARRNNVVGRVG
jgi:hypothetical protein